MVRRKIPKLTLGLRMLLAMHAAGYTTGDMAARLKVSRHSATGWCYGRHQPNHATLEKWAEICDVDLDWLLNGSLDETQQPGADLSRVQLELAQALVAQLLGEGQDKRLRKSLAQLDLEPEFLVDISRDEPKVSVRVRQTANAA